MYSVLADIKYLKSLNKKSCSFGKADESIVPGEFKKFELKPLLTRTINI